jgi:integrase/recombinase XerD
MSALRDAVEEYLTIRRALGFKLEMAGRLLNSFVDFMEESGAETVTTDLAVAWATLPTKANPAWWGIRLNVVRVFARHQQAVDPDTQVPPPEILPARSGRATPYLFSMDEIARMIKATPKVVVSPFRVATFQTLIGLLAVTGMRVGEAIGLDRHDVDLNGGLVHIRHAKFGKSRDLPIHPSTVAILDDYVRLRDRRSTSVTSLFVSNAGTAVLHQVFGKMFHHIREVAGINPLPPQPRPRPHDLRHSFAVRTLVDWYRDGQDVQARLPLLSTYLGHSNPANTYWYLSAAPELFALVGRRLEDALGELP